MAPQVLRPYQQAGVSKIVETWRAGARSVLFILPTGGGKTSCFAALASEVVAAGRRALLVVHRRELAQQAARRFQEFGTTFGYMMAGELPRPSARLQIASVQTLVRRTPPPADLVIFDEAHLSTARTWQQVRDAYPRAKILGCTATPWRLSGKPLVGAYDDCVVAAVPRELRELGFLCPYVGFSYLAPDLSQVKTIGGEFNEQQSSAAMKAPQIVDNVVEMWLKHARELSTIVFNVTVDHSREVTKRFRAAGVACEHLDGSTPLLERQAILRRVESGITRVLCNVGIAVEGIDIPRIKCVVLNRPTKSLALCMQQIGRGRRPWEGQTLRIHDHAFNLKGRHGMPDDDRDYTLNAKTEKPPSLSTCATCRALYSGSSCPSCGAEHAPSEAEARPLVTVADAEIFEFGSDSEAPAEARPEKPVTVKWDRVGKEIRGVFEKQWDEDATYGKQRHYLLRGEKRSYDMPGTSRLNALMAKVKIGESLIVGFTGETDLGGGRARKEFRLSVDEPDAAKLKPVRRQFDESFKDQVCETVRAGQSFNQAARQFELDKSSVRSWCVARSIVSLLGPGNIPRLSAEEKVQRDRAKAERVETHLKNMEIGRMRRGARSAVEDAICTHYDNGLFVEEIASKLNVSLMLVSKTLRHKRPELDSQIACLYQKGGGDRQIAAQLRLSREYVRKRCRKLGLTRDGGGPVQSEASSGVPA